jgi:putative ABC transport system permease protein
MPSNFEWPAITGAPNNLNGPQLWIPGSIADVPRTPSDRADQDLSTNRNAQYLRAVGRLKAGVTLAHAQREADAIAVRIGQLYPDTDGTRGAVIVPLRTQFFGHLRQPLLILGAAVTLVLAIACANVASLLLGRASSRRKEIAVRLALGASRGRLIRQFLTESLLLATIGGLVGLAAGYLGARALYALIVSLPINPALPPLLMPPEAVVSLDRRVLLFTLMLSVSCGIAFGLVPAIAVVRATRLDAGLARRTAATVVHWRLRSALIVSQVAIACVLLTEAGLLVRSFINLQRAETGFDGTNVLTARLPITEHRFANGDQQRAFVRQVINNLRSVPGIVQAALSDGRPMHGSPTGEFIQIAGHPIVDPANRPVVHFKVVTPGYFGALRLTLRRGRTLTDLDRNGAPLAVVINESLARRYLPNEDPIGQHVLMGRRDLSLTARGAGIAPWEIVGVIADERLGPFADHRDQSAIYVTNDQSPTVWTNLIVRTTAEPKQIEPSMRRAIAAIDPDLALSDVKTVDELKSESMVGDRLRSSLLGLMAGAALLLAAIGIYGVIAQVVLQRRHELGIRAALGATAARLVVLIVRDGMALTLVGVVVGAVASRGAGSLLASFLFGVSGTDWTVSGLSIGALALVAAIACYVPARHATRIDPLDALRTE